MGKTKARCLFFQKNHQITYLEQTKPVSKQSEQEVGYFGRNEEGNGKNERPDKVIAIKLPGLKHLFHCGNYQFSDSLFLDSEISFWIVSTDSFNASSCSDVVKNMQVGKG